MYRLFRYAAGLTAAWLLAGCASLPPERGYLQSRELIAQQRAMPANWQPWSAAEPPALSDRPLSVDDAVLTAFWRSPRLHGELANLGFARADLEDARRIGNPGFEFSRLSAADGRQITRGLSLGLTELLMRSARQRLAEGELERVQLAVAAAALALATEVEVAWYHSVSADQVAQMRELVAQAAGHSAELAQRFFDAGNVSGLQLAQERAAAAQADIDATRARAEALKARHELATLMGVPTSASWRTQAQLPAPPRPDYAAEALVALALQDRLDLAAARRAVANREEALGLTRRWRWLGEVELGYERESEPDGGRLRGPALSLQLPIFNQGQGELARAQAELQQARAELDAQLLLVEDQARVGIEALKVTQAIAETYRETIVPERESIVAQTQKEWNFMLVGVFELLLAKQEEYDAYQEYLEAVRDYWVARAELRGAVGGRLPDNDQPLQPSVGVEAILPAAESSMDHSHHGHHGQHGDSSPEDRPQRSDDAHQHHHHDQGGQP